MIIFKAALAGIASIAVGNCSIGRGRYSSTGASANVDLQIVAFDSAATVSNVTQFSINDCHVRPTTATASLGSVTRHVSVFYGSASSGINITDCSAQNGVALSAVLSSVALVVRRLDCGGGSTAAAAGAQVCIDFISVVHGGAIYIDGVSKRIVSNSALAPSPSPIISAVRFQQAVSNVHTLSIKGVALVASIVTSGAPLEMYPIHFQSDLSGSNSAGSVLEIRNSSITGTITTTGSLLASVFFCPGTVSQFETLRLNENSMCELVVSTAGSCTTSLVRLARIDLTSTAIVARGNKMNTTIISGSNTLITIIFIGGLLSGVSAFAIDAVRMLHSVNSATETTVSVLFFAPGASVTMAGAISISDIWIGGEVGCGASGMLSVAQFHGLAGVQSISVTSSLFEFSASSSADVVHVSAVSLASSTASGIQSIAIQNSSIRGTYSGCQLCLLSTSSSISNATRISVSSNVINASATVSSTRYVAFFGGSVNGSGTVGDALIFSNNRMEGAWSGGGAVAFFSGSVGGVERIEASNNEAPYSVLNITASVALLGTPESSIVLESNFFQGSLTESSGAVGAQFGGSLTGVATIRVDGLHLRDLNVSSADSSLVLAALLISSGSGSLAMVHAGTILVRDVRLDGIVQLDDPHLWYGVRGVEIASTFISGLRNFTVSDCQLNFAFNASAAPITVHIAHFRHQLVQSLPSSSFIIENNFIDGEYRASGPGSHLTASLLRFDAPASIGVELVQHNSVRGFYQSKSSSVCVGLRWVSAGASFISAAGSIRQGNEVEYNALATQSAAAVPYNGAASLSVQCGTRIICSQLRDAGECHDAGSEGLCKWCAVLPVGRCVQPDSSACDCHHITEAECGISRIGSGGGRCSWCSMVGKCLNPNDPQRCECDAFNTSFCNLAITTESCKRCPSSSSSSSATCAMPNSTSCRCNDITRQECAWSSYGTEGACSWCPELGACIDPGPSASPKCECDFFNETVCLTDAVAKCKFCTNQSKCAAPNSTLCSCNEISQVQCSISARGAAGACSWCGGLSLCIDPEPEAQPKCDCSYFNESVCHIEAAAEKCKFCTKQQQCVVPNSTLCSCNDIAEDQCFFSAHGASGKCSWCSGLSLCIDPEPEAQPRCECSYFNESVCHIEAATHRCKFCSAQSKCASPSSDSCSCNEIDETQCAFATHGAAGRCSWCGEIKTCIDPEPASTPRCSCAYFPIGVCKSKAQQHECKYVGDKCYVPDSAAVDCTQLTRAQCNFSSAGAGNACGICPSTKMCHLASEGTCPCRILNNDTCAASFSLGGQCHLCEFGGGGAQQACMPLNDGISNNTNLSFSSTTATPSCSCSFISTEADCRAAAPACKWFSPPRNLLSGGRNYCAAARACDPLTCQVIQRGDIEACKRAGCRPPKGLDPSLPCRSRLCAAFFLDGFIAQPYLLLAVGLLKDVAILLLIGVWGDAMLRPLRKWRAQMKRCTSLKEEHELLEARFDETVYILDVKFRDGYDFSMEQYCERLMDRFFVIQSSSGPRGVDGGRTRVEQQQQLRRNLFNAVAFGMFDQKLWIEPEEGLIGGAAQEKEEEEQQQQLPNLSSFSPRDAEGEDIDAPLLMPPKQQEAEAPPSAAAAAANNESEAEPKQQQQNDDDDDDDDQPKRLLNIQHEEDDGDDGKEEEQQQPNLALAAAAAASSTGSVKTMPIEQACNEGRIDAQRAWQLGRIHTASKMVGFDPSSPAVPPSATFLVSHFGVDSSTVEAAMQGRVSVEQRPKIILAAADFDNVAALQARVSAELHQRALDTGGYQLYYTQSRSLVLKIAAVVNDLPTKPQMAYYSLGVLFMTLAALHTVFLVGEHYQIVRDLADPTKCIGGNSSTAAADTDPSTSHIFRAAYFLLAFRIVNSGTFSTAVLVFFKLCRGWWRARKIDSLTLSEMLPILAVKHSAVIKVLIFIYCVQILPFALLGPLYGLPSGKVPALVPLGIGVCLLVLLSLLLHFVSRRPANKQQQSKGKRSAIGDDDDQLRKEESGLVEELLPSGAAFGDAAAASLHRDADVGVAPLPLGHHSRRFGTVLGIGGDEDDDGDDEEYYDERSLPNYSEELDSEFDFAHVNFDALSKKHERQLRASRQRSRKKRRKSTISDARLFFNALMTFLVRQEIVIIIVTVSLQVATNVCCYLFYHTEFALESETDVFALDYNSRTLSCSFAIFQENVAQVMAELSAILPFF